MGLPVWTTPTTCRLQCTVRRAWLSRASSHPEQFAACSTWSGMRPLLLASMPLAMRSARVRSLIPTNLALGWLWKKGCFNRPIEKAAMPSLSAYTGKFFATATGLHSRQWYAHLSQDAGNAPTGNVVGGEAGDFVAGESVFDMFHWQGDALARRRNWRHSLLSMYRCTFLLFSLHRNKKSINCPFCQCQSAREICYFLSVLVAVRVSGTILDKLLIIHSLDSIVRTKSKRRKLLFADIFSNCVGVKLKFLGDFFNRQPFVRRHGISSQTI